MMLIRCFYCNQPAFTETDTGRLWFHCERGQGIEATAYVAGKVAAAKQITVGCVGLDKYGGRVLGRVLIDGEDLSAALLDAGLAVKYGQPNNFCTEESK